MADRTIAVTGSSGLVGSALVNHLESRGDRVLRLVRHAPRAANEVSFRYLGKGVPPDVDWKALDRVDVIVNLAGSTIAERWTSARRKEIEQSRMRSTGLCVAAIKQLGRPVTLVSGSAVGYYGDAGDRVLTEESMPGDGFLASVAFNWETVAGLAKEAGARVATIRTGVVLSNEGGALPQMLRPFKLGAGGRIGSGKQWLSWIDIDDMVRAIAFLIDTPTASGPFNLVAPHPVTNREFTQTVSEMMHRPALFPAPAFALEMIFGEMARETLLASQRAVPAALLQAGFSFTKPTLRESLERFV